MNERRRAGQPPGRGTPALPPLIEGVLDQLIDRARIDPGAVVAEARRQGIVVVGGTPSRQIASLRRHPPAVLDPVAQSFVTSSVAAAGMQGLMTNLGGVLTLPVAVPADTLGTLAWIVRATSGVMNAYGFETESNRGAVQLRVGLLVAGGVSRLTANGVTVLVEQLSRQLLVSAYRRQMARALSANVARRMAGDLLRARLIKAVPLVGGAIGAGVNATTVRVMAARTRAHYRGLLTDWQAGEEILLAPDQEAGGVIWR